MSIFTRVQIYNESGDKPFPTHIKIDGKLVKGVRGIDYHCGVGEVPTVTLELTSLMDSGIDIYNPDIVIKFHPQTIHEAMMVLGMAGAYEEDGQTIPLYKDDLGE